MGAQAPVAEADKFVPGETPDERKRRLKAERDRRYREKKAGGGDQGSSRPPGSERANASGRSPIQDTVNELKKEFAAAPDPTGPGTGASAGMPPPGAPAYVATGEVLLGLCNAVLPSVVARIASRNRAEPVDVAKVRLTEPQVKMLKPAAAPAEAYVLQHLHPVALFAVSLVGAMMANVPPPTAADKAFAAEKAKAKAAAKR